MEKELITILTPSKKLAPIQTGIKSSGTELAGIKACIFDIYGTLLISGSGDVGTALESGSTESFAKAFADCGLPDIAEETIQLIKKSFFDLISKTHSLMREEGYAFPEIDIIEIWTEIINSPDISSLLPEIRGLSPKRIAASYEAAVNPVYPMPGMPELLYILKSRGIRLGIVSNAQFYTAIIMDSLFKGGFEHFGFDEELSIFSYIERRAKPDMLLFKKLTGSLAVYDIKPEETVYIGNDMLKDIMPSAACGYKTALFAGDKRSLRLRNQDDACSNIKPDVIVNKLIDLLNFIQEG